jgi:ubiquinone/menaquinone biosynthesis C-methylase UbiE
MINEKKQEFWNARSGLGETAGSNDFILKRLETKLLLDRVPSGSNVLDIGCGNGDALIQLATRNDCTGIGIDFAPEMVSAARATCQELQLESRLRFEEGHVPGLRSGLGQFDFVMTERCLINLDEVESQHQAFREIMSHLKPGGTFLMIEDSHDGLAKLNAVRADLDLEPIDAPWHNVFLHEAEVADWAEDNFILEAFVPFTSTYYFLSRVVYARLARDKGEELKYDSDINQLALELPSMGDLGAVRLWVWRRRES